ncbi:PREDICTED: protein anon-37Cs [Rhagoletis zephyria]|uniref:protein anon-37Cs n=1 Tax=Rhagoletis zephyria TaxID=28612 RepID=UPI0008115C9D|nr:PREDICTED: protein anon-37Cs [Rhagoletis zephyria]XP_036321001.1 protein anon-37Cs [Rhagoletis pomonella]
MRYIRCTKRKLYNTSLVNATFKSTYPINNSDKPRNEVAVVVVGGGLAGLSAANHLIKNGFKRTIILEATDRCGGRIISKQFGDAYCELGAKWVPINAKENTVYNMVQNMRGLPKKLLQNKDKMYVNTSGEKVDKPLPELIDILYKRLCSHIQFDEKYKAGAMDDLNNVHTYLQAEKSKLVNSVFKGEDRKTANEIFNSLIKEFGSLLGCSLEYVNIEHITKLQNGVHGSNHIYIPTGLDNILTILTKNLGKQQLKIGKPVGEINWFIPSKSGENCVACLDGDVFHADHIICTVPLGVLKIFSENMFRPALPQSKINSIKKLGFGSPVKIYFEYDANTESWLKSSLRPLWSSYGVGAEITWTKQVVEISKMPKSNRVVEIVIGGEWYDKIEKLPDIELLTEITKLIRILLKNQSIPYPSSVLRSNWSSLACYLGGRPYFSTGSTVNDVLTLAEPLGPMQSLLFAGDATIVDGFGTVDGAHRSGIREAQRIIDHYNSQFIV